MGRRNGTSVEQALAASVAANRELRAELEATEKKLAAEQRQLEFHRNELVETKVALDIKTEQATALQRRVNSLAHRLRAKQEHTAGSCSHATDVRDLKSTLTALERRVHDLQQANMARDGAFAGWEPVVEVPAAPSRLMLGRKRGTS